MGEELVKESLLTVSLVIWSKIEASLGSQKCECEWYETLVGFIIIKLDYKRVWIV